MTILLLSYGLADSHQIENHDLGSLAIPIELHQHVFNI